MIQFAASAIELTLENKRRVLGMDSVEGALWVFMLQIFNIASLLELPVICAAILMYFLNK